MKINSELLKVEMNRVDFFLRLFGCVVAIMDAKEKGEISRPLGWWLMLLADAMSVESDEEIKDV